MPAYENESIVAAAFTYQSLNHSSTRIVLQDCFQMRLNTKLMKLALNINWFVRVTTVTIQEKCLPHIIHYKKFTTPKPNKMDDIRNWEQLILKLFLDFFDLQRS